ncbi:MAG: hypothetical protein V4719_03745 [Planctomycetota bacterium]
MGIPAVGIAFLWTIWLLRTQIIIILWHNASPFFASLSGIAFNLTLMPQSMASLDSRIWASGADKGLRLLPHPSGNQCACAKSPLCARRTVFLVGEHSASCPNISALLAAGHGLCF